MHISYCLYIIATNLVTFTVCYIDATKVRTEVRKVKSKYGQIGFEYDLNDVNSRRTEINANNPRSRKKPRLQFETFDIDGNIKPKPITKLAAKWKWNETRKDFAVKRAVQCNLFSYPVTNNKRDAAITKIVSGINKCTDVDVNYSLLTVEKHTKKI